MHIFCLKVVSFWWVKFEAETGRRLINIFIKVCWLWLESFRLLYQFMKAAHILCTATVSTVDIKEQLTDRSKKLTAWSRVLLEKLTGPQLVTNFINWITLYEPYRQYSLSQMHTYRWSFLSARYHKLHARTTSTVLQAAHCHWRCPHNLWIVLLTVPKFPDRLSVICKGINWFKISSDTGAM